MADAEADAVSKAATKIVWPKSRFMFGVLIFQLILITKIFIYVDIFTMQRASSGRALEVDGIVR